MCVRAYFQAHLPWHKPQTPPHRSSGTHSLVILSSIVSVSCRVCMCTVYVQCMDIFISTPSLIFLTTNIVKNCLDGISTSSISIRRVRDCVTVCMAIVFSSLSLIKLIQHELCVRTVSLSVLRSEQGDRGQFIASESDCVQVQVYVLLLQDRVCMSLYVAL